MTVLRLREIIQANNPTLVFLSETHQDDAFVDNIRDTCGFSNSHNVAPINSESGLSLWWKPGVEVVIIDQSKYFIDTKIKLPQETDWIRVTWMYGTPYNREKRTFWEYWENSDLKDGSPWLVIGDLNEMMWPHEKEGGSDFVFGNRTFLNDFVNGNALFDMGFKGQCFTWERRVNGRVILQERLDRALVNEEWLLKWPNSQLTHLTREASDHNPLLLTTNRVAKLKRSNFKFEEYWIEDEECEPLIEESWFPAGADQLGFRVWESNLGRCRTKLKVWDREKFGKDKQEIRRCLEELESIQQHQTLGDASLQITTANRLEQLRAREELKWKQRSRLNWLSKGDLNTHFFHLTTLIRRQKNRITRVKDDNDQWIVNDSLVRREFDSQFQRVFTRSENRDWGRSFDGVGKVITDEMNLDLLRPFSLEEVKEAVFQLGDLKAPGPMVFLASFTKRIGGL